jgi:hypothetical protein
VTPVAHEASGLAYAINRAYHAWIKSQPQLTFDLWDDRGLDETQTSVLRLVEPAGLTTGAEPHRHPLLGRADGSSGGRSRNVSPAGTSAPYPCDGPRRSPAGTARGGGQKGA